MPSVRDMRRRIRSVQNTGKVTNAMSLIAASKMRRAQQAVTQGRPFAEKIQEIITHLAAQPGDDEATVHPLLQVRPLQRVGILVISPDRGLCGGMHANLNRVVGQFMLEQTVPMTDPRSFYGERIPEQFNRAFEKLRSNAEREGASADAP